MYRKRPEFFNQEIPGRKLRREPKARESRAWDRIVEELRRD
jgi:hypothetical protein